MLKVNDSVGMMSLCFDMKDVGNNISWRLFIYFLSYSFTMLIREVSSIPFQESHLETNGITSKHIHITVAKK